MTIKHFLQNNGTITRIRKVYENISIKLPKNKNLTDKQLRKLIESEDESVMDYDNPNYDNGLDYQYEYEVTYKNTVVIFSDLKYAFNYINKQLDKAKVNA